MDAPVAIGSFTGLNVSNPPNAIGDTELSAVQNLDLGSEGQLVKRTGFKEVHSGSTLGANSVHILGFFNTATHQHIIARSGTNVYYSTDGVTWTSMGAFDVEYGVQYIDKFYMVRKTSTIVQWTGTTASAIAGSPSGTFCKVWKDRLFVINSDAAGVDASRVRFSEPFDFTNWPATNYVGIGEGDGDWLIACDNVQDTLIFFKSSSMWNLYVQGADFLSWILRPFRQDLGAISKYSIRSYEGLLFFVGQWGVYSTDGADVVRLSSPVDPYFYAVTTAKANLNSVSSFVWKDKLIITLPKFADVPLWSQWNTMTWNQLSSTLWAGGSTEAIILVYNLRERGWTMWKAAHQPHRFLTISHSANLKGVYSGDRVANGKVYKYGDDVYQDLGVSYTASFDTKEFNFGKPAERKRGKLIGLEVSGPGTYDFVSIVEDTVLLPTSTVVTGESIIRVRGPGYFRSWKFRVTITSGNPLVIYGVNLYLDALPRRPIRTHNN